MTTVLLFSIHFVYVAAGLAGAPAAQRANPPAPLSETFHLNAAASSAQGSGTITVPVTIQITRYTREHSRVAMTDALKHGGYPNFVRALRAAPVAGTLTMTGRTFSIRWAHQEPREGGRTITIVTDKPVYFIGSGQADAKPTQGYEVAVVKLEVNASGAGDGIMAAAARVKPGGEGAVRIDDYAQVPVKLTIVPAAK
jgi:hypothetical protein